MKAVTWCGKHSVHVEDVPDPKIINPRDAIVRITSTAICGSDLHLYDGYIPGMMKGDILGHEFMGEVVEIGSEVKKVKVGDRILVPFTICCGECSYCKSELWSCCDNSNPNAWMGEKVYGYGLGGLYGYSHLTGGYAGGQAQFARVPFVDVAPMKVPDGIADEKVLFLTDIFPTGFMAAENCDIRDGDTIAVWGCGPVGQFAIRSAFLLGAEKVIAVDDVPERLSMAQRAGAVTVDMHDEWVYDKIMDLTGGRGPDACIDAVGMEAHGLTLDHLYDRAKVALFLATDRGHALRQAINCCRKGGTVSIPGVYGGVLDKFPVGALMQKGLTIKTGQTHVPRYLRRLMDFIEQGRIDPSEIITHTVPLDDAPRMYETFQKKRDGCVKVVLKPWETGRMSA